jgi:hypothetical protein
MVLSGQVMFIMNKEGGQEMQLWPILRYYPNIWLDILRITMEYLRTARMG